MGNFASTDSTITGDSDIARSVESALKVGESTLNEVATGLQGASDTVKEYFAARRGGMRDKDTAEHLGKQPEFFDSASFGSCAMSTAMSERPGAGRLEERQLEQSVAKVTAGDNFGTQITFENGARIEKNSDHLITSITDVNGNETQVKWNGKYPPQAVELDLADGSKLVRDDAEHWSKFDKNGNPVPNAQKVHCDVEIGTNGEITRRYEDRSVVSRPDGATMTYDKQGHPIEFHSPTKGLLPQEYKINSDGSADHTIQVSDTFSKIASDSVKMQHKDDPNYTPSGKEIKSEMDRIAKANDIHDYDNIPIGKQVHIPA